MSSDIRQPLTTVGETTGSFPGRAARPARSLTRKTYSGPLLIEAAKPNIVAAKTSANPPMNLNGTATETGAGTRREKKVVVVLGMHRSGTSLVANLLTALGVDLGGNLLAADEHNESGYWEQKEINQIQERLLRQLAQHDIGPGWMNPFPLVWDRLSRPECQDDIHRLKLVLRNEMAAAKGVFGFKSTDLHHSSPHKLA